MMPDVCNETECRTRIVRGYSQRNLHQIALCSVRVYEFGHFALLAAMALMRARNRA